MRDVSLIGIGQVPIADLIFAGQAINADRVGPLRDPITTRVCCQAARDQPHGGLLAGRGVDTCTALRSLALPARASVVQCRCRAAGAWPDDGRPVTDLLPIKRADCDRNPRGDLKTYEVGGRLHSLPTVKADAQLTRLTVGVTGKSGIITGATKGAKKPFSADSP